MKPISRSTTRLVIYVLGLLALSGIGDSANAASQRLPNIIFILADDLGWGDLHCYGHPYAKTPNLDKLAVEGTRFTRFYATGVSCCPARTGLMTGKFPAVFQKYPADFGFGGRVTITELLKKQGYATGHFGKWHIGPATAAGTYGIDAIGPEAGGGAKRKEVIALRCKDAPVYDSAIKFIEANQAGPFYVNIWGHIVHHPVLPSKAQLDAFGPLQVDETKFPPAMREKFSTCRELGGDPGEHLRAYLAEVRSMDDEIGRLLRRLDELGLRENTLVAFSSDQGGAPLADPDKKGAKGRAVAKAQKAKSGVDTEALRMNSMGYAGPVFRGGKHTAFEGGVCVPFIVRWPGHAPAGRVDETSVISGADWLPTLCALTGATINAADFDGEDASKAFLGGFHERTKPLFWKTNTDKSDPAMRWQNWKLFGSHRPRGAVELYDVSKDPGERTNVAEQEPLIVQELSAKLKAWTDALPKTYEHGGSREN